MFGPSASRSQTSTPGAFPSTARASSGIHGLLCFDAEDRRVAGEGRHAHQREREAHLGAQQAPEVLGQRALDLGAAVFFHVADGGQAVEGHGPSEVRRLRQLLLVEERDGLGRERLDPEPPGGRTPT